MIFLCDLIFAYSLFLLIIVIVLPASLVDVDGATLLVEVDGSSSPKVHPGCPVTQLGQGVNVRDGHEVNRRQ